MFGSCCFRGGSDIQTIQNKTKQQLFFVKIHTVSLKDNSGRLFGPGRLLPDRATHYKVHTIFVALRHPYREFPWEWLIISSDDLRSAGALSADPPEQTRTRRRWQAQIFTFNRPALLPPLPAPDSFISPGC